jgi:hypothetical protein
LRERGENFWIACAEVVAIGIWIFHRKLQALIPGVELDILQYSGFFVWAVAIYGWIRARARETGLLSGVPIIRETMAKHGIRLP